MTPEDRSTYRLQIIPQAEGQKTQLRRLAARQGEATLSDLSVRLEEIEWVLARLPVSISALAPTARPAEITRSLRELLRQLSADPRADRLAFFPRIVHSEPDTTIVDWTHRYLHVRFGLAHQHEPPLCWLTVISPVPPWPERPSPLPFPNRDAGPG